MLVRRCSAKGSARNRDENRVRVDTDQSFVSIHPPWHLTSTSPRTMSPTRLLYDPLRLDVQPTNQIC